MLAAGTYGVDLSGGDGEDAATSGDLGGARYRKPVSLLGIVLPNTPYTLSRQRFGRDADPAIRARGQSQRASTHARARWRPAPFPRTAINGRASDARDRTSCTFSEALLRRTRKHARHWGHNPLAAPLSLALLGRPDPARAWLQKTLVAPSVRKDLLLKLSLRADRLRVLALLADSEELAGELDAYLHLPTRFESSTA